MSVHPSQAERVTTWFRDDCSCPVLDPNGDDCALHADFTDGLCSHCHGHALDAARSPEPGLDVDDRVALLNRAITCQFCGIVAVVEHLTTCPDQAFLGRIPRRSSPAPEEH